jgi:hypothetical protein
MTWRPTAGELLRLLHEHSGIDFATLVPAGGGESRSVFVAMDHAGAASIVKILPDSEPGARPDALGRLRALETTVARLRGRGYPAPRMTAVGRLPGLVYWITERISGAPLDAGDGRTDLEAVARFLPRLIQLNDAQAGLGTGDPGEWPELVRRTLTSGGDGYCVHATLEANSGTRDLLAAMRRTGERFGADIPDGRDFTHYDFTPANLMSDGTALTGVIDINPVVLAGDRAFDLASMLFYCYDHDKIRPVLRDRLLERAEPGVACTYLAHIALRQADWSLRFYPGSPGTGRHLRLAETAVADIRAIAGKRRVR